MKPYYADESVTLYHGDCRDVVPAIGLRADCVVVDPPYGETSLAWDRWPDGWPEVAATVASSMWCFGSMRMFLDRRDEFAAWRLSQDVVWEKHAGSGFQADRFKRVHEHALHWYRGPWAAIYKDPIKEAIAARPKTRTIKRGPTEHYGKQGQVGWVDEGTRLAGSVIRCRSMHGRALHPTEKPPGLLDPADPVRLSARRDRGRPDGRLGFHSRRRAPLGPPLGAHRGPRGLLRADRQAARARRPPPGGAVRMTDQDALFPGRARPVVARPAARQHRPRRRLARPHHPRPPRRHLQSLRRRTTQTTAAVPRPGHRLVPGRMRRMRTTAIRPRATARQEEHGEARLMARIRSVKPDLRTSQVVASWPYDVRYAWVLLWGYLDDYGRGLDVPKGIAGDCFPHDDEVTPKKMDAWLTKMTVGVNGRGGPLCRYEVGGVRYLHCVNWSEHQRVQRPTPSKNPPCPLHESSGSDSRNGSGKSPEPDGNSHGPDATRVGDGDGDVSGDGDVVPPPAARRAGARKRPSASAGEPPPDGPPGRAERIVTDWIRGLRRPPQARIVDAIGIIVQAALGEGQDPDDVAEGLRRWQAKGRMGPAALPSFIHEAANAPTRPPINGQVEHGGFVLNERTVANLQRGNRMAELDAADNGHPAIEGSRP